MSAEKLRGGFYTPAPLVQFCLDRLGPLLPTQRHLAVLEPSAGDGAFLTGLGRHRLGNQLDIVSAVEPLDLEAEKSRRALAREHLPGEVLTESAIRWAAETNHIFDVAVGNPPFVRYQFISEADRGAIAALGERSGISFAGVSNLWIPVLVAALSRLKADGAFCFVIPTELLTGISAARLRQWLVRRFDALGLDLFPPGSFPGVLQEVAVLTGQRSERVNSTADLTITDHADNGAETRWTHSIDLEQSNWTRYLLNPAQLGALEEAIAAPAVKPLAALARFQVSVVTGANDFFCVSDEDRKAFSLSDWARPLLPRIRHAPGLLHSVRDQAKVVRVGAKSWLLDFAEHSPDPLMSPKARDYLNTGEARELHKRYKCRIREPWFRIPHIDRGSLLMSKRSHRFPRVVVNAADAYTTDTIYRGAPVEGSGFTPSAVSSCFHSSLTLLTAELEGRSFGGGVLELVPSEIRRLALAAVGEADAWITELDLVAREAGEEALVEATDTRLVACGALPGDVLVALSEARHELMRRRLDRNAAGARTVEVLDEAA